MRKIEKERIGYYDIARGIGIILVVIGHIGSFYMPFRSYVTSFHMALFLMISGMLFIETGIEKQKLLTVLGKKCAGILLPYFLYSFLAVLIESIRLLAQNLFYWPHIRILLERTLTLQGNSVMWFLPALFVSEMLFLSIRRVSHSCCRSKSKNCETEKTPSAAADVITLLLVLVIAGIMVWCNIFEQAFYARHTGTELYERLHDVLSMLLRGMFCTIFICIGYFIRKYIFSRRLSVYFCCLGACVLIGVSLWLNQVNPGVDLRGMNWGAGAVWVGNYYITTCVKALIYVAGAVTGALGIILLCKAADRFQQKIPLKILAFLGCNSLIIMATHLDFHVLHFCTDLADMVAQYVQNYWFYHITLLIYVLTAEAGLIWVINRFFPVLAAKGWKKKNFHK